MNTTNTNTNATLPQLDALKAENALLKEALFGKNGVASGLAVLEKCLATAQEAKHETAPFPLDAAQASLWHRANAGAYLHALELISIAHLAPLAAASPQPATGTPPRASSRPTR